MALFTASEARSAFRARQPYLELKDASRVLFGEQLASIDRTGQQHDVFISYSHLDSDIVLGVCYILRDTFGLSVYIDRDDSTLSGDDVEVAKELKRRMSFCRSLLYIASDNDSQSHWMPWELGFFDGLKGTVAVLPVTDSATAKRPQDRPYLRIYPYIDRDYGRLWVIDRKSSVRPFTDWLRDQGKFGSAAGGR